MIQNTQKWNKKLKNGFNKMICHGWTIVFGHTLKIKHILQ